MYSTHPPLLAAPRQTALLSTSCSKKEYQVSLSKDQGLLDSRQQAGHIPLQELQLQVRLHQGIPEVTRSSSPQCLVTAILPFNSPPVA